MSSPRFFWKQEVLPVAQNFIKRYFQDEVGRSAAALAYYLLFSFFPLLIFLSSLISFLDLPPLSAESFQALIPADIIEIVNTYLTHIAEVKNGHMLLFGLFFTLYFTMRAVDCLMRSIKRAYRVNEKKVFPLHQIQVFLYTIFLMVIIFASLLLMTIGRTVLTFLARFFPIPTESINFWNVVRFFILAAMLFFALSLLYLLVPGKRQSLRQVLPGTIGALISWLIFSMGFAYYVEHMAHYSVVYGSIGAIIVLLLWLYCSSITLILGAELNCAIINKNKMKRQQWAKTLPGRSRRPRSK